MPAHPSIVVPSFARPVVSLAPPGLLLLCHRPAGQCLEEASAKLTASPGGSAQGWLHVGPGGMGTGSVRPPRCSAGAATEGNHARVPSAEPAAVPPAQAPRTQSARGAAQPGAAFSSRGGRWDEGLTRALQSRYTCCRAAKGCHAFSNTLLIPLGLVCLLVWSLTGSPED